MAGSRDGKISGQPPTTTNVQAAMRAASTLAPVFLFLALLLPRPVAAGPTPAVPTTRDTLVFTDGDRVQGHLLRQDAAGILFQSDRFGELRVPAGGAVVIRAERPATAPLAGTTVPPPAIAPAKTAREHAEDERLTAWERFSPAQLTARMREIFGSWHGRLTFANEMVTDVANRKNSSAEATLGRKWTADEIELHGRFDYAETDHVATSDVLKSWGQWRHRFNPRLFSQYRPTAEWNRASRKRGVPNDYVLLQQEIGAGYQLFTRPARSLRVGLSQNLFDTWSLVSADLGHTSRGVQSLFEEGDLVLPWRMAFTQRGVWYPVAGHADGWEHRIELNKKLTETLTTAIRHEVRRNNPDGNAADYTRLRLLFGLDF